MEPKLEYPDCCEMARNGPGGPPEDGDWTVVLRCTCGDTSGNCVTPAPAWWVSASEYEDDDTRSQITECPWCGADLSKVGGVAHEQSGRRVDYGPRRIDYRAIIDSLEPPRFKYCVGDRGPRVVYGGFGMTAAQLTEKAGYPIYETREEAEAAWRKKLKN